VARIAALRELTQSTSRRQMLDAEATFREQQSNGFRTAAAEVRSNP
jgi:hypothetical protein